MIRKGVAYYPEFWPEHTWEADLRQMAGIGIDTVRLAEFAWASMEPEEGNFTLGWLERILDLTGRHGIGVLLCTPTATPPKWLTHRYPDTRVIQPDGRPSDDYGRKYYCPTSPRYRELSRRINEQMARVATQFDHVVAWQIDNEMGPHEVGRCFCPQCAESFKSWLREKYGSLDVLNDRWQTAHWSQRISAWEELDLPANRTQPAVTLDFCRFGQDSWTGYFLSQKEALREFGVRVPISTNFMSPIYEALDYWDFARHVDLPFVDHYVGGMTPPSSALGLDLIRSLHHAPFWVTETGANGEGIAESAGGEVRLWGWRAIARGARGIFYFRWRTCLAGAEDRHPSLLTHAHVETRGASDIRALFAEIAHIEGELGALPLPRARVAIVFDWMALLARSAPWKYMTPPMEAIERHLLALRTALFTWGIDCEFVPPGADLSGYRLAIVPGLAATLASEEMAAALESFARSGGVVLATADLASRDQWNNHYVEPRPRHLTEFFGIQVGECRTTHHWASVWSKPPAEPVRMEFGGVEGELDEIVEVLVPADAEVAGRFVSGPLRGQPAATRRPVGEGTAIYVGSVPAGPLLEKILGDALAAAGIERQALPAGVEYIDCSPFHFYLNSTGADVKLKDLRKADILVGSVEGTGATLPPYGVLLLREQ